ncbi:MAG: SGNH/GDSL hydrolase family protein, partial [Bryobacterales bacterium]
QAFEKADKAHPPKKGGVVFYGSSSIRKWDLAKAFPGKDYVNRGFGGSTMPDAIQYLDRVVLPLQPTTIVLYEGDNDIGRGDTGPIVFRDFKTFVDKVHAKLPQTKIVYLAIKPSLARWHLIEQMRTANLMIKEYCYEDPRLIYVDTEKPMLGPDGTPRKDLFVEDGLHMTDKGYAIWNKLVAPYLN